ncbi:MAG: 1-pyrroline-5-carboxylate dehydrogenase [Bacteroidetes bacterium HGW-Bacteroidetes-6]|jgi:1-pyrroline-5-carboxylate dehydrogenase|nr:MAG: 1-pyrroline-5-carboxylate dehydrogenase [Bacteroidetes bacterium HGW-Bacteroidetes-6]
MNNAIFQLREPQSEPVNEYLPGSPENRAMMAELSRMENEQIDIPLIIGGKEIRTGKTGKVVSPHNHQKVLATYHIAGETEVKLAIEAAMKAKEIWGNMSWVERISIFMKAAELMSKKYRYIINAATMLGQGKNLYQAEIDAACESIDYLRFNCHFVSKLYDDQPKSDTSALNRIEFRPLEGFVFAISPFNFTAIALNLSVSPALMGNTIVWKPATTALLSNYYLMQIYKEAGLPDGVINFVPGPGSVVGNTVLASKDLGGIHFTGGTDTFNHLWQETARRLNDYISYPKLVGETGGKDFIVVHRSADPQEVAVAIVRGAFEYQGQKCSAASRSYISESLWPEVKSRIQSILSEVKVGDVKDLDNFMNAVIDKPSFDNIVKYIEYAKNAPDAEIIAGGTADDSVGYFVQPTVIVTTDPHFKTIEEEIFGPVMTIYVYKDSEWESMLKTVNETSPYALTGSVFARDRQTIVDVCRTLRYAAGNFYYNDKPSGAMVGLQPFGGARKSGTNDKAGGELNLIRWTSPRTIKETFIPATDFKYPYMK